MRISLHQSAREFQSFSVVRVKAVLTDASVGAAKVLGSGGEGFEAFLNRLVTFRLVKV